MSHKDEIKKAIGAHGLWKTKLRTAVDAGKHEYKVDVVRQDDQCEFGKWLATLQPSAAEAPHMQKAKDLHAQFHREAANVLKLVETGQKDAAGKALGQGSTFEKVTTQLTLTLMNWQKAA